MQLMCGWLQLISHASSSCAILHQLLVLYRLSLTDPAGIAGTSGTGQSWHLSFGCAILRMSYRWLIGPAVGGALPAESNRKICSLRGHAHVDARHGVHAGGSWSKLSYRSATPRLTLGYLTTVPYCMYTSLEVISLRRHQGSNCSTLPQLLYHPLALL